MWSGQSPVSSALDAHQRAVVDAAVTTCAVVVGAPGSGKTSTLVARVGALVESGTHPDAIVVLTASRRTATALRDRLALAVGRATSGPMARSVTSFAFQLERTAAVEAGVDPPRLLTGNDEDQLIHDLLDGDAEDEAEGRYRWPGALTAAVRSTPGFRGEVRAFLAECASLGVGADRLRQLGDAHEIPAWNAMSSFLAEYRNVCADMRGGYREAAGLVRDAVSTVSGRSGSKHLGGISVILVDDAQELTLGGVQLLEACARRGIAVVAFGDPDIGSGGFRGATPENFARLVKSLGSVSVLPGRHRGTRWQHELVRRVTERIGAVGVVDHRSPAVDAEPDRSVRALTLRSAGEEYDAIARLLRERHVHDGIPWSSCAVIAHDSRQVAALVSELAARDVPTRSDGPGLPLGALTPVRDLLKLIELAARDEWSFEDAADVLTGVCGRLDPIELRRLRSGLRHIEVAAGGQESGNALLLSALGQPLEFDLLDTREARRAGVVARTLAVLGDELERGATAHELVWTAWDRSGLERTWAQLAAGHGPLADQANRDLDAVVALFQSAKRFVERSDDADARVFVRGVLDSSVAQDRLEAAEVGERVRILTPAGALGAEFDTVVIAGVQDGVWPNTRLRGSVLETWRLADAASDDSDRGAPALDRRRGAMHDELRLLARALSRATSCVIVTAVDDDGFGPSVFFEFLPDPEHFRVDHPLSLRGLVAVHRRTLTDPTGRAERVHAAQQLALLADAGVAGAGVQEWFGVAAPTSTGPLRDVSREVVRVSPSRLHTLEECQLNWVVGDLGGDPGGTSAGLGTIIHAALEHAVSPGEADLWAEVESRWGQLSFEAGWRERAERIRARDLVRRLHLYLRAFEASGATLIGAEPHFEVPVALHDTDAGDHGAILSGYIDRVELTPDKTVVIVDLKTGKSEPQTDAKVIDNLQLGAYQLAFESGAIPAAAGRAAGGAALLVLRPTAAGRDYATPRQPPFDHERRAVFLARVRAAVQVMRGSTFTAPYEDHCRDEHSHGLCRIHTIAAVSAS